MSETKHTPGPWQTYPYIGWSTEHLVEAGGIRIAHVPGFYVDCAEPTQAEANARLIAAAPDLYDALERLLDIVESQIPENTEHWREEVESCLHARLALASARGELAKARGEAVKEVQP